MIKDDLLTGITIFTDRRNDPEWKKIYDAVMENADKDNDGLLNGEEIEIYQKGGRPYLRIKTDPRLEDTDGDGINDKKDPHPLMPEEVTVNLPNIYAGVEYLNIDGHYGGNQSWWGSFSNGAEEGHPIWNKIRCLSQKGGL